MPAGEVASLKMIATETGEEHLAGKSSYTHTRQQQQAQVYATCELLALNRCTLRGDFGLILHVRSNLREIFSNEANKTNMYEFIAITPIKLSKNAEKAGKRKQNRQIRFGY
jgi:hypothetical protein